MPAIGLITAPAHNATSAPNPASGRALLSKLSSGVLPPGVESPASDSRASFASLLEAARKGGISSGREVTPAAGSGVQLSDDERTALSVAADALEASGSVTALIKLNGRHLTLDVTARRITAESPPLAGHITTGIDAVMDLDAAPPASALSPDTTGAPTQPTLDPAALLQSLAGRSASLRTAS
jgi:hypothetical protein